jgi:chromosome segregation ATPase
MKRFSAGCLAILMLSFVWARAERRRDPFNQVEIDELRDAAQEPEIRLKLYVKFARARLDAVEKVATDSKETDKPQATHDRLQDFLDVYDELNDNVDTYADRNNDIRKPLKTVIEADNEFQAKLRALKDKANTTPEQAKPYEFLLSNATDTLDSSVQDHRQLLTEQEDLAKRKKLVKPDTIKAN